MLLLSVCAQGEHVRNTTWGDKLGFSLMLFLCISTHSKSKGGNIILRLFALSIDWICLGEGSPVEWLFVIHPYRLHPLACRAGGQKPNHTGLIERSMTSPVLLSVFSHSRHLAITSTCANCDISFHQIPARERNALFTKLTKSVIEKVVVLFGDMTQTRLHLASF